MNETMPSTMNGRCSDVITHISCNHVVRFHCCLDLVSPNHLGQLGSSRACHPHEMNYSTVRSKTKLMSFW